MNNRKGFLRLFRFGIKPNDDEYTQNQIQSFNFDVVTGMLFSSIALFVLLTGFFETTWVLNLMIFGFIPIGLLSIYFNIRYRTKTAVLIRIIYIAFLLTGLSLYFGRASNIHYLLLLFSAMPFIHFPNRLNVAISISTVFIGGYVFLFLTDFTFLDSPIAPHLAYSVRSIVEFLVFPTLLVRLLLLLFAQQRTSSKLQQREEELIENEVTLNAIFQNSSDFIWAVDTELNLMLCNERGLQSFREFYGVEVQLGSSLKNILPPKAQKEWESALYGALEGNKFTVYPKLPHQGKLRSFSITYGPLRNTEKEIVGCSVFVSDITKQREVEQKKADAESLYKNIFNNSYQGIVIFDFQTLRFIDCNEKILEIFGIDSKEQLMEQSLDKLVAKEQKFGITQSDIFNQAIKRFKTHSKFQVEGIGKRLDGTTFTADVVIVKNFSRDKQHLVFFVNDVTKARSRNEAIQQISESIVKSKGENFIDDLAVSFANTFDLPFVLISKSYEKGKRFKSISKVVDKVLTEDTEYTLEHNSPSFAFYNGVPEPVFYQNDLQEHFRDVDYLKELNANSYIGVPLINENKEVIGHFAAFDTKPLSNPEIAMEVMLLYSSRVLRFLEQVEAQKALEESEERYKLLYESGFDGIMIFDLKKHQPISANKKLQEFYGYTNKELATIKPRVLMAATQLRDGIEVDSEQLVFEYAGKVLKEGKSQFEWRNKRKSGELFDTEISAFQLPAPNQHLCLAIFKDITERKQAAAELAQRMEEINEKNIELERYIDSNMQLENFAYVASHDMKEPLRTIVSFSQILNRRYKNKLDDTGKEYLQFIIAATKNMSDLINDLLTFSKVNTEDYEIEPVNLPELLSDIEYALNQTILEKNAIIEINGIPSIINADHFRMRQLFQNLISNGIKFHKPNTIPIVTLDCQDKGNYWQFKIADNGIGIKPEFFNKIFLIFKRLHGKQDYDGTGIGLALCKRIVEQFDGKIWIESEYGAGTTFHFTIKKMPIELSKD